MPARATAPTMRISLEKSPLRRKAMTRKVTKKIAAVPKSLISAKQPIQKAEKIIKTVRFPFSYNSSSVAAPAMINATFTSSPGWIDNEPNSIQFFAPPWVVPNKSVARRSSAPTPRISIRISLERFRSRRNQHRRKNKTTPIITQISCFITLPVCTAVTARLRVERKKAMVSISKATRLNERRRRKYTHITALNPRNAVGMEAGQSSP